MFNILFYLTFILYEEFLYKSVLNTTLSGSVLSMILFVLFITFFICFIGQCVPKDIHKFSFPIFNLLICIYYGAAIIVKKTFSITISLDCFNMATQFTNGGFINTTISVLSQNILIIFAALIPFIVGLYYFKFIQYHFSFKYLILILCSYILFSTTLNADDKNLYYHQHDNQSTVNHFGVLANVMIDSFKTFSGFKETVVVEDIQESEIEQSSSIKRQIDESIEFVDSDNESINEMNQYFKTQLGTSTNDYTRIFEGKNLIYIMAESFDGYFVNEELTPTLYKFIHNGFYFSNYYSPTNLSTIGGEFSLLTSLLPELKTLNRQWSNNTNYFPYGLATLFKQQGYLTYAYHDHEYNYQNRDKYLQSLGFDNYQGCGNGLETKMDCTVFPESDNQLIEITIDDYINDDHFMVYYATVSGHGQWGFGYNDMSEQNKDKVMDLDYSDTVKAYIAAQLELEKALTTLINKLEQAGKLDDTVIVLAADHHPYFLENYQMQELAGQSLDQFSLYKNNLIIYNSEIAYTKIDKVCNTIDVLPTTLNLFGITYDSRILMGQDIFSSNEGLVIFSDYSWISDSGSYSSNGTFTAFKEISNQESYSKRMVTKVKNKYIMSKNIMLNDYYRIMYKVK